MGVTCFFKGWPGAGPCDGRLIAAHLIPKQLLRREVCSARTSGSSGRWPVTVDQRAELARILWDPRVIVPCCGGPTGIGGHHGKLDAAAIRPLRIPREKLPDGLEEYVEALDLPRVRTYLNRTYPR